MLETAKFKITYAKLRVPIVIYIVPVSTKHNVNLKKQLSDGFKRSLYCNNYQAMSAKVISNDTNIYQLHSASFQVARRLFTCLLCYR